MTNFNFGELSEQKKLWQNAKPFPHIVIDNFLPKEIAEVIAQEFPSKDSQYWHEYSNPLEIKKTCNDWNKFSKIIYKTFADLMSEETIEKLSFLTDTKLYQDQGLHGGGLHCHGSGGKLNAHLDYSIHPKLGLQRKINIIIYMTKDWDTSWGGNLGLWNHDEENNTLGTLNKSVDCVFNRAVIFDTTMNSWHGLPDAITCPDTTSRNSLAVYYLCEPPQEVDHRERVLFAPTKEQENDPYILDLIQKRADSSTASSVYRNTDTK